jgi:glyoxylate/hydroxypyruvate reductase
VFVPEPLPADSPLWNHPKISVFPHIAALTEPRTSVAKIAQNVELIRQGKLPRNTVDFSAGY